MQMQLKDQTQPDEDVKEGRRCRAGFRSLGTQAAFWKLSGILLWLTFAYYVQSNVWKTRSSAKLLMLVRMVPDHCDFWIEGLWFISAFSTCLFLTVG